MNAIKTTFLLALLTSLLVFMGSMFGGREGAIIAFVVAAVMNIGAYWFSDKMVLARYRGREVDETTEPEFYGIVRDLADKAGMPMPRVFVIPTEQPNAFATGRDPEHAAVAATQGLLDAMPRDEIEGVMAHELSHVRHRDTLIGSVAATVAGAIMMLANFARFGAIFGGSSRRNSGNPIALLIMAILAPIAAALVQMAISRSREFAADAGAAEITRNPRALASALRRLESLAGRTPMRAGPETAHLFIVNPFSNLSGQSMARLFSTHPPTDERARRLESMALDASLTT